MDVLAGLEVAAAVKVRAVAELEVRVRHLSIAEVKLVAWRLLGLRVDVGGDTALLADVTEAMRAVLDGSEHGTDVAAAVEVDVVVAEVLIPEVELSRQALPFSWTLHVVEV